MKIIENYLHQDLVKTPINSEETPINSEETPINSEETPEKQELSTQRKEKKIKGNNNRERGPAEIDDPALIPDEVHIIWRKSYGRNCNLNEYEFTIKLINIAGKDETLRHIRELSKSGFRILKSMEDRTQIVDEVQPDGTIKKALTIKPKEINGTYKQQSKGSVQSRLDYRFDPERYKSDIEFFESISNKQ